MIAVHLDRVSVTYISQPIFRDLSWEIHTGRCAGLVGPNGCGKSTLLKLIAGALSSDSGYIVQAKGLTTGYLAQEPELNPEKTVWEEALSASEELTYIEEKLAFVESQLGEPNVYEDEAKLTAVLEQQSKLLDQFEELGGANYESRVRSTLGKLGFLNEVDLNLKVETLSGGQKKLIGLTKLLVTQPDILLLDEPDNHLDLAGKRLLEEMIRGFQGATIIVSHDRYLLDLVVDEIAELEDGRLTLYPGDYSGYAFEKQTKLLRQQQLFQAQDKEISRLEQAAKRLLTWGRVYDNEKLIKRGRNILKRIDRIDRIEKPIMERKRMGLALEGWRGSNKVLEILNLHKSFVSRTSINGMNADREMDGSSATIRKDKQRRIEQDNPVLTDLNLLIWHGERVGLVGPNGAGKSVLFRLILGEDYPTGGEIKIGPSVEIGYYAQEHEILSQNSTLIETIRSAAQLSESNAVSFLGNFLFTYEQARGPVSELSGGERSRLQMALLMLSNANFLLLDEPTNNLDIPSAEVLESVLGDFEGTVFVISHDRYFLDRVVDRIVELDDGTLLEYLGNYSDYEAAKQ
ncbi:MAG: ABC-F family ATP-binding cassette domain-containing protein [Chloroflexota bacterium]